jgi:hypothetical protein
MYATEQLNRLGLDKAADERAIKRAYARELKQIDQEADAAGFQVLRHAYEYALEWVRHQAFDAGAASAAPETVDAAAPAPAAALPVADPQVLAEEVFARFSAACEVFGAREDGGDAAMWKMHLQRCAGDDRLINLSARAFFEYMVAGRLADGWRPGHEKLFVAACELFRWTEDRRRLVEFGRLGSIINQAIEESEMFGQQGAHDCDAQTRAMERVRLAAEPDKEALRLHAPHLERMVTRFPAWTAICASAKRIMEWVRLQEEAVSYGPRARAMPRYAVPPEGPDLQCPWIDADTGEDLQEYARIAYHAFMYEYRNLNDQGNTGDSLLWRRHLQACADDERLRNPDAFALFECRIARLLAEGWRPGHEALFVAARQVFGWDKYRQRLINFGEAGRWIGQAIVECERFCEQQSADVSGQADALERIRADALPGTREVLVHAPHLRNLMARFPAWAAVIASKQRMAQWIEAEQALPAWRRRLRWPTPKSGTGNGNGKTSNWWILLLVIVLIRAFSSLLNPDPTAWDSKGAAQKRVEEEQYRRAAGALYSPPGQRKVDLLEQAMQPGPGRLVPQVEKGRDLNDRERKAIARRVQFKWQQADYGSYRVEFEIDLDERGGIAKLVRTSSSGLPLLDQRTEEAIRASAPFGPEIKRRIGLFYSWTRRPPETGTQLPNTRQAEPPNEEGGG